MLPTQTYKEIDLDTFRNKLKLKSIQEKLNFTKKHPHAKRILDKKGIDLAHLRAHSAKILGAGLLGSALLINSPSLSKLPGVIEIAKKMNTSQLEVPLKLPQEGFLNSLSQIIPSYAQPLTTAKEKEIEELINEYIKIPAKANLEGEHLNTTYGLIGAEQHLRRSPGDTMAAHDKVPELDEGMAPGLGAWGYFAPSEAKLTQDLVEKEKWYAVVQTLYLPDWQKRLPYLRDWYKYRKVLIINTINGRAVVADIADSGPAAFTGKQFGGSPEVMYYLGGARYKKGPVILFFVDDPSNKIPLGPVNYNELDLGGLSLKQI